MSVVQESFSGIACYDLFPTPVDRMSTTPKTKVEPDVAEALARIRERLATQAKAEIASRDLVHVPASTSPVDPIPALRQLLASMQSATSQIGELTPRRPGIFNSCIQRVKRFLQRILSWYTRPITEAQGLNTTLLTEATRLLECHETELRALEQQIRVQAVELTELRALLRSRLDWIIVELQKQEREGR